MLYRPEIDGLRALAVVPVILFHAGHPWVRGGYIGVDIFFVISGYLIASILVGELANGGFSLLRFYERRARRILPALFLVVCCCIPFAWMWMTPVELQRFAASVLSVTLFYSNHYFLAHHTYFSPLTDEMPLLHTWSLAVEEQFYLVFPLFLAGLWRLGRSAPAWGIAAVALASLAFAIWMLGADPVKAFYLAASRAWQLAAGSLCALYLISRTGPQPSNFLALAGLACIILPACFYGVLEAGPGITAMLPVAGAMLIILFAAPGTIVCWLLSLRPVVWVGLISYSAYLWHQPLFAFARLRSMETPSLSLMLSLSALAFVLAAASWWFVERPFRKSPQADGWSAGRLTVIASAVAVALIGFSAWGHLSGGLPNRTAPSGQSFASLALDDRLETNHGLAEACDDAFTLDPECRTADAPETAIWGDSFAMHLVPGLAAGVPVPRLIQLTKSSCVPVLDIAVEKAEGGGAWTAGCIGFNDQVIQWLGATPSVTTVILSSTFWGLALNTVVDRDGRYHSPDQTELAVKKFRLTVEKLRQAGKKVVVVSPPPFTDTNLGNCLKKQAMFGGDVSSCDFSRDHLSSILPYSDKLLQKVSAFVPVVDLVSLMCGEGACKAFDGGKFLYRDNIHLSKEGSALLGSQLGFYKLVISRAE